MLCVVQKPFVGNGQEYIRNQLIEGDQFRNVQSLIGQHYMRPATADEIESASYEDDEPAPLPKKKKTLKARIRKRR